ncbi:hypothetical protein Nepgr_032707 [Nepenthes gracilis]|uniref:Uncharacterized protein n=1 Tax=Nepenthes gracilis TaxID=150966 RepID=A0AAD3TKH4_NEPGR|nr:hypothetical protein Nepgr_032707 [Nepenthes gracilis]
MSPTSFPTTEDKTSMVPMDLHNPTNLGDAPALCENAEFRKSLTQAHDSVIIAGKLLVDAKTVKSYVALLSSDGRGANLGNLSCVQIEAELQRGSLIKQGGNVEKHRIVADHKTVSYTDILKGERVDCKSPSQEMFELNLGGEQYDATRPGSSQADVIVAADLIGRCCVNQMKTAAMGQNAHGVIQTGPMLQVSSSKPLQSSVKKPKKPIPHSPVFGTRPMPRFQMRYLLMILNCQFLLTGEQGLTAIFHFRMRLIKWMLLHGQTM